MVYLDGEIHACNIHQLTTPPTITTMYNYTSLALSVTIAYFIFIYRSCLTVKDRHAQSLVEFRRLYWTEYFERLKTRVFTVRRSAVIVILSVRLSVGHTRGLCPHGSTYDHDFFTVW